MKCLYRWLVFIMQIIRIGFWPGLLSRRGQGSDSDSLSSTLPTSGPTPGPQSFRLSTPTPALENFPTPIPTPLQNLEISDPNSDSRKLSFIWLNKALWFVIFGMNIFFIRKDEYFRRKNGFESYDSLSFILIFW